ncbi:hypothetical protein Tco_0153580 [Tanacetum coccineum]
MEGKAPMVEEDIQATHKTKEQMRQEEAGLEEAIRMEKKEALTEQQKKRKAQVQFEAQFYTEKDWDTIRAKLEANAELVHLVHKGRIPRIMAGRSTRSNTSNNTNPPNNTTDEVTRQLNTAFPNLLTQLVQALRGNRANQREVTPSCSIKTFRASGAKEFFGTKGAVGLLTWFESIESMLHITKCPPERQVEFAASMLQGRALTWWNTLDQTRGRAAAIAQS